jgi:hypothetical protein
LSRCAEIKAKLDFSRFRMATLLPRDLLHSHKIAKRLFAGRIRCRASYAMKDGKVSAREAAHVVRRHRSVNWDCESVSPSGFQPAPVVGRTSTLSGRPLLARGSGFFLSSEVGSLSAACDCSGVLASEASFGCCPGYASETHSRLIASERYIILKVPTCTAFQFGSPGSRAKFRSHTGQ